MIGGVLAYDVATITGWAYAKPGSIPSPRQPELGDDFKYQQHTSGWKRLAGASTDQVRKYAGMKVLMLDHISLFKPSIVVFEAPYVGGMTNQKTARMLLGLAAIVEMICDENGIRCTEANKANGEFFVCQRHVEHAGDIETAVTV